MRIEAYTDTDVAAARDAGCQCTFGRDGDALFERGDGSHCPVHRPVDAGLVERLKEHASYLQAMDESTHTEIVVQTITAITEAAARITALEAEVARLRPQVENADATWDAKCDEVKRLREALEFISNLEGEINPSNYDHDDACNLNRSFCEAITTAAAAAALGDHP